MSDQEKGKSTGRLMIREGRVRKGGVNKGIPGKNPLKPPVGQGVVQGDKGRVGQSNK